MAALRLSDSVRSLSSRRDGRPKRPPRILVRVPRTRLLLVDQGLDLRGLRRQRNLSLPSWIRVCVAWISFQTFAEMELVFRSEMPPFARVRLYPCVPYVPLSM